MIKGKVTILIDRTINGCTSLVQDLSMELRLQRMFLKAQIKYNRLIIQYIKPVTCSSYTFGVFVDEYWKLAIVSFNFLLKSYFVCTFLEKKIVVGCIKCHSLTSHTEKTRNLSSLFHIGSHVAMNMYFILTH